MGVVALSLAILGGSCGVWVGLGGVPGVWGEVLGWVLAGSAGFGGRLGSSLEGSGVGFEGSWGAFGAIPKMYKKTLSF